MKKWIAILLLLATALSLVACGKTQTPATTTAPGKTPAETTPEATTPQAPTTPQASIDALNGKKIIFIGNSYTFFGRVVHNQGYTVLTQKERTDNRGLFYYLCQEKGIDVEVTNWTFGGHDITDSMGNSCTTNESCSGKDHLSYLTDRNFDYVCIQPFFEAEYAGDLITHLTPTMELFREANPDVKFLLLVPHATYFRNFVWKDELQKAVDAGITVVNWGGLMDDLINKKVTVPGGTQQYFFSTFVVSRDENDGHHQNLLGGYLTAMMTYCAITGESCVDQPYAFADDSSIHPSFDMEKFMTENYILEPYTNFVDIYRSETEMLGLQTLADQYIYGGK